MASGESIRLRYIQPKKSVFHDSFENGTYVNPNKDRTLAGKARKRQRRYERWVAQRIAKAKALVV